MGDSPTSRSSASSASSPEPQPPREAKFSVLKVEKLPGEELATLQCVYVITSVTLATNTKHTVLRTFHEFQFLAQQLFRSGACLSGYIIPPFPQEPITDPVCDASGRQLPGHGNFVPIEIQLFNWTRLVLAHPLFGHSGLIEPFLIEKELPPPGKIRKPGIIKTIQETIDSRKYAHKDCDTFFQMERDWSNRAHDLMQTATESFNSTVSAKHSLTQVLAHLSAALSLPIGDNRGFNKVALRFNLAFSKALDGYRDYVEADTINGAATLGATLHLWTQYVEAEREMLNQRTCLLVDYESANRTYDRSRNNRRTEAVEVKQIAERAFENCSEIARKEIKRFQDARITDFAQSIQAYRVSQLALAKDHYQKLSEIYRQCTSELNLDGL